MNVLLFANTDWFLYNFRLPLAQALRAQGFDVLLLAPPGPYGPRMEAPGMRYLPFPLERAGMNPLVELGTVLRLARLYRRERPALVHHSTIKCVLYGSLAARLAGVDAVVNSITGLGYAFMGTGLARRALQSFVRAWYRLALRRSQVIFENGEDLRLFVSDRLLRPEQAHLVRGAGVDLERFRPSPLPDDPPLVMLAARMLRDKGVVEFVEAARHLRAGGERARFVLVGDTYDGNPSAIPSAQLRAWQEEGTVEWWGWRDDMHEVLASATIVCLPSYREGLPKVLVEAAACGRPIVASDIAGCREVVTHGENGLLVPVGDVAALAEAIRTLLRSPDLRTRFGMAGRLRAEREFSVGAIVARTLEVCRLAGLKQGSE